MAAIFRYNINRLDAMIKRRFLLLIIAIFLSGCGSLEMFPTEPPALPTLENILTDVPQPLPTIVQLTPLPTKDGTQMPVPILPAAPSELLDRLIEQAIQDLAQRLSISAGQISIIQAREVVWSDSSLGCPQPGMMYLMVLSPGFQIILSDGSREYHYHASQVSPVFYCENPSPPASGAPADS